MNIDRLMEALSRILSQKYGAEIKATAVKKEGAA